MGAPRVRKRRELLASSIGLVLGGIEVDFLIGSKRSECLVFSDIPSLMTWLDGRELGFTAEGRDDHVRHCRDLRADIAGFVVGATFCRGVLPHSLH